MDKIESLQKLDFGNEIEAVLAIEELKNHLEDKDIFNDICRNYLFSDMPNVSQKCHDVLGIKGRIAAHAKYFRGEIH